VPNWIDITVPLRQGIVAWPGDPDFHIRRCLDRDQDGGDCTVSQLEMSAHTGTHMDAPFHFIADAATIEEMPLDATVGTARVIGIEDPCSIRAAELRHHGIQPGERILFRTANSSRAWNTEPFREDFVFIAKDAAEHLAERRIRSVGIDYLSVGGFWEDLVETHRILLGAGIWVMEGLNLSGVEPGGYELICLPLLLEGADGAPARAILKQLP
jgi:arylformamidase